MTTEHSIKLPDSPLFAAALQARHDAVTEQEKALAEDRLWAMADPDTRKRVGRRDWLHVVLPDEGSHTLDKRARLVRAPQVLWDRINAGTLLLTSAVNLLARARKAADQNGTELSAAVDAALVAYDKLPLAYTPEGKPFRRNTTATSMRTRTPVARATASAHGRSAWVGLRQLIGNIVLDKVGTDVPENVRDDLYKVLDRDIRTVIASFTELASRAKGTKSIEISRPQVVAACQKLHVDPPAPAAPIDLTTARQMKVRLARVYHPDANKGDETLAALYDGAIKAYAVLEMYARRYGSTSDETTGRGGVHHEGDDDGADGTEDAALGE